MTNTELQKLVKNWGREKKIYNPVMQLAKVTEELGELAHEITRGRGRTAAALDALGDVQVTLIILADILGLDYDKALETAWNEIKYRTGETKNGSFVKEEDSVEDDDDYGLKNEDDVKLMRFTKNFDAVQTLANARFKLGKVKECQVIADNNEIEEFVLKDEVGRKVYISRDEMICYMTLYEIAKEKASEALGWAAEDDD